MNSYDMKQHHDADEWVIFQGHHHSRERVRVVAANNDHCENKIKLI